MKEYPNGKRGLASVSPERRSEIGRLGGSSVPPEKRYFSVNRVAASKAGRIGGMANRRPKEGEE